ncbi:MAG: hypothetical protein JWQ09_5826 [Segetibacter sp.]|nr:hypothetical protein [Segetibacter sp.]
MKTETTFNTKINNKPVVCNEALTDFELLKKASTHIDCFGICRATNELFIQFTNGTSFMYTAVPLEVLEAAKEAESIGKFYHATIKGKYNDASLGNCFVVADDTEEDDYDNDYFLGL